MSSKAPGALPPSDTDPGLARLRRRKRRGLALLLPVSGAFLFLPPAIRVFEQAPGIGGVPAIVLFLFGVWAGLVFLARRLSRQLAADPDED